MPFPAVYIVKTNPHRLQEEAQWQGEEPMCTFPGGRCQSRGQHMFEMIVSSAFALPNQMFSVLLGGKVSVSKAGHRQLVIF